MPIFTIGDTGKLTCGLAKSSATIERVFWYKGNSLLRDTERYLIDGTELNILKVEYNDRGRYICKVRIGKAYVRGRVNVKVASKINLNRRFLVIFTHKKF